ncbi:MAG TPA: extensin, partial [Pseudolabrys sp.]
MSRAVRRYLLSAMAMLTLAACGRGMVSFEERPAWRAEAEQSCLKSGAVKVSTAVAQMDPITGPGMCGAEFPLKVAALGSMNSA